MTGDMTQKDLASNVKSGLEVALKVLKNIEGISFITLTSKDVVRHPLVQKIVQAYDVYEKKNEEKNNGNRQNRKHTNGRTGKTS